MKLIELIRAVNEKKLTKDELEQYHGQLAGLYAEMQFELAELRKQKAVYFLEQKQATISATEHAWSATHNGLREIELSHYCKATEKILSSLKNRLYSTY